MEENRVAKIYEEVVAAIKDVVNAEEITEDELKVAGEFLNEMGKAELFTNMLNVAFSMTVVERRRRGEHGTRSNLEGPYYFAGSPVRDDGLLIDKQPGANANFLEWTGKLLDAETGKPLTEGEIDIWQANENGDYDNDGSHLRGVIKPDPDGRFQVRTVVPVDYSEHGDDPIGRLFEVMGRGSRRAAHLHVKARAPGYRPLTTQLFVPWSDHLHKDYVEGAVMPDLILDLKEAPSDDDRKSFVTHYDITLQRVPA